MAMEQTKEILTSEDELENLNKERAAKIGSNPLILQTILYHLPDDEILKYRHVNTLWNDLGSMTLLQRESIEILFTCTTTPSLIIHKKGNSCQRLEKLTKILKTSSKFPCTEFHFYNLILDCPDLNQFLGLYGPQIKSLWLGLKGQRRRRRGHSYFYGENDDVSDSDESTEDSDSDFEFEDSDLDLDLGQLEFFKKLLQKVPNLESLSLHGIPLSWSKIEVPGAPLSNYFLPSLKSLQADLRGHSRFAQEILKSAINLERYEQSLSMEDGEILNNFIEMDKVHVIQFLSLNFDLNDLDLENWLEFYEKFAQGRPQVREIKIELNFNLSLNSPLEKVRKVYAVLFKILQSSQKSLRVVKLSSYTGGLPLLYWPKLDKVRSLFIDLWKTPECDLQIQEMIDESSDLGQFEKIGSVDWTKIFPALHELVWDDDLSCDFPFLSVAPSVKCLQFMRQISPKVMGRLPEIFPKLEKLSMKDVQNFPSISKNGIWRFTQLKSLYLGMDIDGDCPINSFPHLDAAFTGFSPVTCQILDTNMEEINHFEELRHNPSILDLKHLRVLGMRFYDFDFKEKEPYNFISKVMGLYAIRLMPNLTVHVYCKSSFSKLNAARMVDCITKAVGEYAASITGYPTSDQEDRIISSTSYGSY